MAIVTHKPRRNLGTFMDNSFNRTCHPYLFPQPLFWSCVQKKRPNGPFRHVTGHWTPVPHPITSFPSLHTLLVPPIGFPIFTSVSYLHSLYGSFYDLSSFIFCVGLTDPSRVAMDSKLEDILQTAGVDPAIANQLVADGWTLSTFACCALDMQDFDKSIDEMMAGRPALSILERSQLRAAFKACIFQV